MKKKVCINIWNAFCVLTVIFMFASIIFMFGEAIHDRKERAEVYEAAMVQMNEGNFEEAIEQFASISVYQDSQKYVTYLQAVMFQEDGRLKEAARLFGLLGDFKDSESRLEEIAAIS